MIALMSSSESEMGEIMNENDSLFISKFMTKYDSAIWNWSKLAVLQGMEEKLVLTGLRNIAKYAPIFAESLSTEGYIEELHQKVERRNLMTLVYKCILQRYEEQCEYLLNEEWGITEDSQND
jgi:hypothetical protein